MPGTMSMGDIIVIAFRHPEAAQQVAAQFLALQHRRALYLGDARVVVKDGTGRLHVKDMSGRPVVWGILLGGLLGVLMFVSSPVLGLLIGAAAGGILARQLNPRVVDNQFVNDVAQALKPDTSAVFLQVSQADHDAVVSTLRPFRGTLIQTSMPADLEEELRRALAPIKPRSRR